MADSLSTPPQPLEISAAFGNFVDWCRRKPLDAALLFCLFGVGIYFGAFFRVYQSGSQSLLDWARSAWNAENDLEHGPFILPTALVVLWMAREKIAAAPKRSSLSGLLISFLGALLFVASVRTVQPRIGLIALPVLGYGFARYFWGPAVAKETIFPCALLLFMIPIGFFISRTVGLQLFAATTAGRLANLLGCHVTVDGAQISALDNSFNFEVAGGCSGIRSLTAMTLLGALYVHFTQDAAWKKLVIFSCSLLFSLAGNLMRVFTVVLFARYINPKIAGGIYHDYSGFIFFPIAVGGMLWLSGILNHNWKPMLDRLVEPPPGRAPGAKQPQRAAALASSKSAPQNSGDYDY